MLTSSLTDVRVGNIEISKGTLQINLTIKCDYDPTVHSPKVTLIARTDGASRFIPILVHSYYQNVDLKTCTIIAEYTYNLEMLFFKPIKDDVVSFDISLLYGETYFENLDVKISGDVICDEEYNVLTELNGKNGLFIKRAKPYVETKKNIIIRILRFFIGGLYYIFVRLVGLAFIPYLLIDALMAFFDFKSGYVSKNERTPLRFFVDYVRVGFHAITREDIGRKNLKKNLAVFLTWCFKSSKVVDNRVTFLSNRRDDLSGNFEDIYEVLKNDESIQIEMLLDPRPMHRMSFTNIHRFARLYATSKVVIVDDFYELTSMVKKKDEVKLVQVWHACGAFKTFGFTRLGKPGGPKQTTINHRMYDRAIVSSSEIRRFYAEGFGIPIENVVATGVPRTDMFFDEKIKEQKREDFYAQYPSLREKKIILFAPTFRGNGRLTGYYPMNKFDFKTIVDGVGDDYAILVKMHPFVNNPVVIPDEYKNKVVFDFSENSELNDLLFITDILITDYSSVVFEASLLDVPMLLYAYDLSEYISTRDFYYEYKPFIPGKLVRTQTELIKAINASDFETDKIDAFKHKFFDELDGKSAWRVAQMIKGLLTD